MYYLPGNKLLSARVKNRNFNDLSIGGATCEIYVRAVDMTEDTRAIRIGQRQPADSVELRYLQDAAGSVPGGSKLNQLPPR